MPGIVRASRIGTLFAVLAALAIAGCGGGDDGSIPQEDAELLLARLDAVESNVNSNCDLANDQAAEFADLVRDLPAEVDGELRTGLEQASERLEQLTSTDSECVETGTSDPTGTATEPEVATTPTTTLEEEPTTTQTETTETTTEEEPPVDEEPQGPPVEEEPLTPPTGESGPGGGNGGGVGPTGGIGGGGD